MLPTPNEIKSWTDDKLLSVIKAGETINWNSKLDNETKEEYDYYVEMLYSERDLRPEPTLADIEARTFDLDH